MTIESLEQQSLLLKKWITSMGVMPTVDDANAGATLNALERRLVSLKKGIASMNTQRTSEHTRVGPGKRGVRHRDLSKGRLINAESK